MDIKKAVTDFVNNCLAEDGYQGRIGDEQSLIDSGILDSLAILELLGFLDDKFDIIPAEDELYSQNFDSINLIHKFVEQKLTADC